MPVQVLSSRDNPVRGQRYRCEDCGSSFKFSAYLNTHKCFTLKERTLQCPKCPKRFGYQSVLEWHLQSHTKSRPFPCPKCPKRFKISNNLHNHLKRVHSGLKPVQCRFCPQRFSAFKADLLRHERKCHTGVRPVRCPVCFRNFSHGGNLRRHLRVHTKEKPFACQECGSKFGRSDVAAHHYRTNHPNVEAPETIPRCEPTPSESCTSSPHREVNGDLNPLDSGGVDSPEDLIKGWTRRGKEELEETELMKPDSIEGMAVNHSLAKRVIKRRGTFEEVYV
ncbi:hypothetical protein AAMO2058_001306000 [Amorphochlora amoebiformis]